jgi:hypothetical protein
MISKWLVFNFLIIAPWQPNGPSKVISSTESWLGATVASGICTPGKAAYISLAVDDSPGPFAHTVYDAIMVDFDHG